MTQKTPQKRRHERFPFHNSVILTLADGREIPGTAENMGYGGASMTMNQENDAIILGEQGKIKVIFYGRPTEYPCSIVSINGTSLGLKLHRTDYVGAPEELLQVKES